MKRVLDEEGNDKLFPRFGYNNKRSGYFFPGPSVHLCPGNTHPAFKKKTMNSIQTKELGSQGLVVPVIGLGCMGMTKIGHMDIYGQADEAQSIATIHRSLELGGNFLDTADLYGPLHNERLVAKAIRGNRDQYVTRLRPSKTRSGPWPNW